MATYSSKDIGFVSVGGLDIKGRLQNLVVKVSAALEDTIGFGVAWSAPAAVGIALATFTLKSFWDDATNAISAAMQGKGGTAQVISIGIGNAFGDPAMAFSGMYASDYGISPAISTFDKADVTGTVTGAVDTGVILYAKTSKSTAWTGTALDNGASSANGAAATLQVDETLALGGYTNWLVKVQHSTDNSTWADLMTFTAVTAGPTAERKMVAGTVNQYTRVTGALTGSGTAPVIVPDVVFARF